LAENEPLVQAVQREKERRTQTALPHGNFLATPDVLNDIIHDANLSPRHRVDACRELRAVATSGSEESTPVRGDRFVIRIDLSAGEGEVLESDKTLAVESKKGDDENKKRESDEPIW